MIDIVDELRQVIDKYIKYYNFLRPHSSLDVLLNMD
ncbi:MAG: integrase core domain-containing protein [Bacteroidales bacterium]|nr:integrase core domain-containing protein [Bacteroidales bacterium]